MSTEIHQASTKLTDAFKAKDLKTLESLYLEDALIASAGKPALDGRNTIMNFYEGILSGGIGALELTINQAHMDQKNGLEVGTYVLKTETDHVADTGNYMVHWQKTEDGWKVLNDFIVTDVAAAS